MARTYPLEDAKEFLAGESEEARRLATQMDGSFVSGFVRATRPMAATAAASAV